MANADRIDVDPFVMLGKPVIRGTRVPVELLLRKLSEGATEEDLLDAYPRITRADIRAAISYAAGRHGSRGNRASSIRPAQPHLRLDFLADESLDFAVVRALRAASHDVLAGAEVAGGSADLDVIKLAGQTRVSNCSIRLSYFRPVAPASALVDIRSASILQPTCRQR